MNNSWMGRVRTIYSSEKLKKVLFWSVLAIILTTMFFCFVYTDILITVRHSLNLIQTMVDGHPMGFYAINQNLIIDKLFTLPTVPTYGFPIFVVFAIWNAPLWIAQSFFHISVTESLLCLIWIKLMLIVFLAMCSVIVSKICSEIKIDSKHIKWVIFAFVSSPLLIMPLFIMNQYDIIALFFILLGIWMYVKGNFKWFIFWFAIAIPIKMFGLFIFIPLLLLRKKKIIDIIKYGTLGLLPMLLVGAVSSQMYMYKESTAIFTDNMLAYMFKSVINVNLGNASLFFMAFIAIMIFCYMKKIADKDELNKFGIYIPLAVLTSFFAFVSFHPQWIILITPFMAIIMFQNMRNHKVNILLDILSSASILVVTLFYYFWVYDSTVIQRMVIPKLFGSTLGTVLKYGSNPSTLLAEYGVNKFLPFFLAAYIVSIAAMLIINYPKIHIKLLEKHSIEWGLLFTRMLIIVPIPILMIYCYYAR